jgi:hypothetical protein
MDAERRRLTLVALPTHLAHGGQLKRLKQLLLSSPEWMDVKYLRLGGDQSYLDDIRLALTKFGRPTDAASFLTLLELHTARTAVATRADWTTDWDLASFVWLGRDDEALVHARIRDNPAERCRGLLAIVDAWLHQGRSGRVTSLLSELRQMINTEGDERQRFSWLLKLASQLAGSDARDKALEVLAEAGLALRGLPRPSVQHSTEYTGTSLVPAGVDVYHPGLTDGASVAVGTYTRQLESARELVTLQAKTGVVDDAEEIIELVTDKALRVELRCVILEANFRRGDVVTPQALSKLLDDALDGDDLELRAYMLSVIARTLHAVQEFDGSGRVCDAALKLLPMIEALRMRDVDALERRPGLSPDPVNLNIIQTVRNLGRIGACLAPDRGSDTVAPVLGTAERLARNVAGDPEYEELSFGDQPARYLVERVDGRVTEIECQYARRVDAVSALAETYAQCGRFEAAREAALGIDHPDVRSAACYNVAREMVANGRVDDALDLTAAIGPLALYEGDQGPRHVWVTNYMQSVLPRTFSRFNGGAHIAYLVVRRLAEDGKLEPTTIAARTAAADDWVALEMMRVVAYNAARTGEPRAADWLEDVRSRSAALEDARARDHATIAIARALARSGDASLAVRALEHIADDRVRLDAYRVIAEHDAASPEAGTRFLDAARRTVDSEQDPSLRVMARALLGRSESRIAPLDREAVTADLQTALEELQQLDPETSPMLQVPILVTLAETVETLRSDDAAPPDPHGILEIVARKLYGDAIKAAGRMFPRVANVPLHRQLIQSILSHSDPELARESFNEILYLLGGRYPSAHARDASEVAEALARAGEFDLAVSLAATARDEIRFREPHLRAMHQIILELCRAGRIAEAAQLMLVVTDRHTAAVTFAEVAVIMYQQGRTELGAAAINLAELAAKRIAGRDGRDDAMSALARALAELDNFTAGYQRASKIADQELRTQTTTDVATLEMRSGNFVHGLEFFRADGLDLFVVGIADSCETIRSMHPHLVTRALCEVTRIASWTRGDWTPLYTALSGAANDG